MTSRPDLLSLARKRAGLILACGVVAGAGLLYLSGQPLLLAEAAPRVPEAPSSRAGSDTAGNIGLLPRPRSVPPKMDDARAKKLLDFFGLTRLGVQNGSIVLSHSNKIILENFYSAAPYEVLLEGMAETESALALRYGDTVAKEFRLLVQQYHDYDRRMAALDAELNLSDQIGDQQVELARRLKITFQDEAFGYERSASLFRAERKMTEAMERHKAELDGATDSLSEDDVKRMTDEYRAILAGN